MTAPKVPPDLVTRTAHALIDIMRDERTSADRRRVIGDRIVACATLEAQLRGIGPR